MMLTGQSLYLLVDYGRSGLLSWLNRFVVLPDETVGSAIRADLALRIVNAIGRIIGACAAACCTSIIDPLNTGLHIHATCEIILRHVRTIEMRPGGEGAADTEDQGQGHKGPLDFFHTRLFFVITME